MVDFKKASISTKIVNAILNDLSGRGRIGFDAAINNIDDEIKEEMIREMSVVVYRILREESGYECGKDTAKE